MSKPPSRPAIALSTAVARDIGLTWLLVDHIQQVALFVALSACLVLAGSVYAGAQDATAQVCSDPQLKLSAGQLPKGKQVELRSATKYLPAGDDGELLLRHPLTKQMAEKDKTTTITLTTVRVFTNKGMEQPLRSLRSAPNKNEPGFIEGFLPADSVVVRFRLPDVNAFPAWHRQDFLVLGCNGNEVVAWGGVSVPVSNRLLVIVVTVGAMVLLYVLFTLAVWWVRNRDHPLHSKYPAYDKIRKYRYIEYLGNPVHLTANAFNHASVQKLQILMFSFLVAGMLLSFVLETGNLSDLSLTVVTLLGISGVGTALGQAANQERDRLEFTNWAWLVGKEVLPIHQTETEGPSWRELVLTSREFDMYKFQILLFSVVVAVALVVAGEGRLASFEIPATLLGILGLSQGVYLAGVLVRPPSIDELNKAITKLRELEQKLITAFARNMDLNDAGELVPAQAPAAAGPPSQTSEIAPNARRMFKAQADLVEKMIESTLEVEIDRAKLNEATTTALQSSPNPSINTQTLTFTATVSSNSGTPSGTVTFNEGSTMLGTGTLASGVAVISISTLGVGSHSIIAAYGGDSIFQGSTSSALIQTINPATTTTALQSSPNPSTVGQSITLRATVSSTGGGTPSGTVAFQDGSLVLGTGTLSGGAASYTAESLSPGDHTMTAVYSGDANFQASTSPALMQTVNLS